MDPLPPPTLELSRPWTSPVVWIPAVTILAAVATVGSLCVLVGQALGSFMVMPGTAGEIVFTLVLVAFAAAVAAIGVWLGLWVGQRARQPLVLTVEGGTLQVRHAGLEPVQVELRGARLGVTAARLQLVDPADRPVLLRVPGGHAQQWQAAGFLEDHGVDVVEQELETIDPLVLAEEQATHAGVRYRLDPVWSPMPLELMLVVGLMAFAAGWVGLGMLGGPLIIGAAAMVGLSETWCHGLAVSLTGVGAAAMVAGWVWYELWRRAIGVQLTMTAQRLEVEVDYQAHTQYWSTSLADVQDVTVRRKHLIVTTLGGEHRVPLMGRSSTTRAALEGLIEGQQALLDDGGGSRDEVPERLRAMLGRLTE